MYRFRLYRLPTTLTTVTPVVLTLIACSELQLYTSQHTVEIHWLQCVMRCAYRCTGSGNTGVSAENSGSGGAEVPTAEADDEAGLLRDVPGDQPTGV